MPKQYKFLKVSPKAHKQTHSVKRKKKLPGASEAIELMFAVWLEQDRLNKLKGSN